MMDTNVIDSVVLTYVSYGTIVSTRTDVVKAVGVTFSEKEVVYGKDLLWEYCKDSLSEKPDRRGSINRTEKMAHPGYVRRH